MLSTLRRSSLTTFAALALASIAPPVLAHQPAMVSAAPRPVKAAKRMRHGAARTATGAYGRKGAGVSMAQQQRASRKKRGVSRNRVNHR